MTSTLIILSGILLMSCGVKEKEEKTGMGPGDTKAENVLIPKEIESNKIKEMPSIPENDENSHAKTINTTEEKVDKNQVEIAGDTIPRPDETSSIPNEEINKNAPAIEPPFSKTVAKSLDHGEWDKLLNKYVDSKGNVAYNKFLKDVVALTNYLEFLSENVPAADTGKNELLAYYINLYNAATVKLILDNYPVNSIKDISSPWDKKWVKAGTNTLSLGQIEHKILRKMNEPRIHFAINCASFSCPKLVNSAFVATSMEMQLEKATKDFINDPTRNIITTERLQLSNIFKWYKKDFTEEGSLIDYINPYNTKRIAADAKINYLKYNWSLNETK